MRTFIGRIFVFLLAVGVAGCGGGGSGGGFTSPKPTIRLEADRTALALNPNLIVPGDISTRTIVRAYVKDAAGNVVSGEDYSVQFTATPTGIAALYDMVWDLDPDADNGPDAYWSYPVSLGAGLAQMQLQAYDQAGTMKVVASYTDVESGITVSDEITVTVGSGGGSIGMPASVILSDLAPSVLYVSGIGSTDSAMMTLKVLDAFSQPVANPSSNNLKLEIVSGPGGGERLQGRDVSGQTVTGQTISVNTTSGVAQVALQAGTLAGTVTIRVTADGSDNDVDNGISASVVNSIDVTITDGKLASLTFAGSYAEAVLANHLYYSDGTDTGYQDGTYSRVISVIATSADGNPVPDGTLIHFGLVDGPISNYPDLGAGTFDIQGAAGNPEEGGYNFHANDGTFVTDRVTPLLDRVVLDGKDDGIPNSANDIHTGVWRVASVLGEADLTVTERFNGGQYDTGATVPWIIGHAMYGSIMSPVYTVDGVATTVLTYPATRIGQAAVLTAQGPNGVGAVLNTGAATYLGAPGYFTLMASKTTLTETGEDTVTLCARDSAGNPVPGLELYHEIEWLDPDDSLIYGSTTNLYTLPQDPPVTGANGCATFDVHIDMAYGTPALQVVFFNPAIMAVDEKGNQYGVVNLYVLATTAALTASITPDSVATCPVDDTNTPDVDESESVVTSVYTVTATLLTVLGEPLPNSQLNVGSSTSAELSAYITLSSEPPVTDANGELVFTVTVTGKGSAGSAAVSVSTLDSLLITELSLPVCVFTE